MIYLMLFVEGILTFISPCILPLIPIYLSYFGAMESDKNVEAGGNSKSTVKEASFFVLGFSLVFVLLSLLVNSIGQFLLIHRDTINIIAGSFLVLFGIDLLLENRISSRLFSFSKINYKGQMNSFVLGVIFAISWTPCVGVYLASALALSMTANHFLESALMLVVYSLGLGIPFILSALLIEESKQVIQRLKSHLRSFQIFSAILLILFGISVATGYIYQFITI